MSEHIHQDSETCPLRDESKDSLGVLLDQDAKAYPLQESSWFAARVAAMAQEIPQQRGAFPGIAFTLPGLRWLIPIPLAGVAVAALFLIHQGSLSTSSKSFSSSESEFEQHMEMFASNDYSQ